VALSGRVGYDAGPWLDARTGVGRYSFELARSLRNLGAELVPFAVSLRGRKMNGVRRWRVPARAAQSVWRRFDRPYISRLTGPVDLVHGTNFVLPAVGPARGVVTVHDLSFYRDDTFPGSARLRDLVPWSIERAARVLTPTEAVAGEVRDRFGVPEAKVVPTAEGVGSLFFGATPLSDAALAGMGIRPPFVLAVGTIEPRKNLTRLLAAWRAARRELPGWMLVIAGPTGWGPQLRAAPGVVPIGWVGDETLPGLLAAAELFCYPSLYEGFGLPPLEAMAAGTATLVGNYPAAPEVLAEAAVIVDGTDTDAIADGLTRLCTDDSMRIRFARAGRARAVRYTWEKTAQETITAYAAAMSE
jgi:glycosyltransferase involved in cell wall biosynthesis